MSNETLKDIITMDDDPMDARLDEEEWDEPTVTPLKERDNAVGTEKFDGETVKFFTHRLIGSRRNLRLRVTGKTLISMPMRSERN